MRSREHLRLWRVIAVVLAGLGAAMPSMPMASDCMPCAICCLAPSPTAQGFSGDCSEAEEPGWQFLASHAREVAEAFDTGGGHPRLPIRIVYCRWRD